MNQEEAKQILQAWCPGEEDHGPMREAFALMEKDPELADWFGAQQATDDSLRTALQSIAPPPGLREAILQQHKVTPFPSSTRRTPYILVWAAAAAITLAAGVFLWSFVGDHRLHTARIESRIPALTQAHQHAFEATLAEPEQMRQWLSARNAPSDFPIPASLTGVSHVGCEVISIERAKVSILCFDLGGGRIAHLYVVDRRDLADAPSEDAPAFRQMGDIAMASWSQGDKSFFLAERGSVDSVRGLL
jgi:hypothetical protein